MYSAAICLHLSRYDLPDISMELLKEAITLATRAGQGRGTASAEWLEVERCLEACSRRTQPVMTSPAWQSIFDHIFSLPQLAAEARTVVNRIFLLLARRNQEVLLKQILDTLSRALDLGDVYNTLSMMTSLFKSLSSYPPGWRRF